MKKIYLFFLIILINSSFITALAIVSDYHKESPLIVNLGESKDIQFVRIQNPGEKNLVLKIEILQGQDIIKLQHENLDEFIVPAQTYTTPVNMIVSLPEKSETEHIIELKFTDITPSDESGTVSFSKSLRKEIKIVSKKETAEPLAEITEQKPFLKNRFGSFIWWLLIIVLFSAIVLVIIYFIKAVRRNRVSY